MLHSLVVGLGNCGARLHVPVLLRLRRQAAAEPHFADGPLVGVDPWFASTDPPAGVAMARSLREATRLAPPDATVVHVCTPPGVRARVVAELAELGYRRVLVEKPLATDVPTLDEIDRLRGRWGLDLVVISQWLASRLTRRIRETLTRGELGTLRSVSVIQRKPRYTRSLHDRGHRNAFDVEVPHAVAIAIRLAGAGRLRDAGWSDLTIGDTVLPRLGTAWLSLEHRYGVRTDILSDLATPVRERRITVRCTGGTLVGHYPNSAADQYAQLRVATPAGETRSVFPDDALTAFVGDAYRRFAGTGPDEGTFALHSEAVRLLSLAKVVAAARGPVATAAPAPSTEPTGAPVRTLLQAAPTR